MIGWVKWDKQGDVTQGRMLPEVGMIVHNYAVGGTFKVLDVDLTDNRMLVVDIEKPRASAVSEEINSQWYTIRDGD